MYNSIVKDYRYITKDSLSAKRRYRVIKGEEFPGIELPIFKEPRRKADSKGEKRHSNLSLKPKTDKSIAKFQETESLHSKSTAQHKSTAPPPEPAIDENELKLKLETRAAYLRGLSDGKAQGIAEWSNRAQHLSNSFNRAFEQLNTQLQHYYSEIEQGIIELSVHLAEKIVGDAALKMHDVVKENLDKCINLLAGAGQVTIKINPADYDSVKTYLPSVSHKYEGKFSFVIEPDQNINSGGCLVELDGSIIDARIDTQLANIKSQMRMLA